MDLYEKKTNKNKILKLNVDFDRIWSLFWSIQRSFILKKNYLCVLVHCFAQSPFQEPPSLKQTYSLLCLQIYFWPTYKLITLKCVSETTALPVKCLQDTQVTTYLKQILIVAKWLYAANNFSLSFSIVASNSNRGSVIVAGHIEKKQDSALWQWVLNLIPVNLVRLLMLWTQPLF